MINRRSATVAGLAAGHGQAMDIKRGIGTMRERAGCEQSYVHDEGPPQDQRIRQLSNLMALYIRPRRGMFFGDHHAPPAHESSPLL